MRVLRLLKYGFLVLGLSLLGGGIYNVFEKRSFMEASVETTGTIVRVESITYSSTGSSTQHSAIRPTVRFVAGDGQEVKFKGYTTSFNVYEVGDQLRVWYDPRNPARALHSGFVALWLMPLLAIVVGGLIMTVWSLLNLSEFLVDVWLRFTGVRIQTRFARTQVNPLTNFNGLHPYTLISRWQDPRTGRDHEFRSADVWADLSRYSYSWPITVYMKRDDPGWHYVDISFLKTKDLPPLKKSPPPQSEQLMETAADVAQRAAAERLKNR